MKIVQLGQAEQYKKFLTIRKYGKMAAKKSFEGMRVKGPSKIILSQWPQMPSCIWGWN